MCPEGWAVTRGLPKPVTPYQAELMAIILALECSPMGAVLELRSDCEAAVRQCGAVLQDLAVVKGRMGGLLWTVHSLAMKRGLTVQFTWVKGHAMDPFNCECDSLAKWAAGGLTVGWPFPAPQFTIWSGWFPFVGRPRLPSASPPLMEPLSLEWVKKAPLFSDVCWKWANRLLFNPVTRIAWYDKTEIPCPCGLEHLHTFIACLTSCEHWATWRDQWLLAWSSLAQSVLPVWLAVAGVQELEAFYQGLVPHSLRYLLESKELDFKAEMEHRNCKQFKIAIAIYKELMRQNPIPREEQERPE